MGEARRVLGVPVGQWGGGLHTRHPQWLMGKPPDGVRVKVRGSVSLTYSHSESWLLFSQLSLSPVGEIMS